MRFNRVGEILKSDQDKLEKFRGVVENVRGVPLVGALGGLLSNDNTQLETISDKNVLGLVNLLLKFNESLGNIVLDNEKIERTIEKMERPFFKMRVSGRVRVATAREVNDGATGLFSETKYALADDKKRKALWLLAWAASGNDYYYYKIGKGFNKEVVYMKLYSQISNATEELAYLLNWAEDPSFMVDLGVVKRFAKDKYTYPDYEVDEVIDELTRKQVLYMLDEEIPRGTENKEYRRALALIIKEKTNKYYTIPPNEVAELRELYKKVVENKPKALRESNSKLEMDKKLKNDCEYLISARDAGVIQPGEFVFKIIGTLRERGYVTKVSEKQYKIIKEALEKVGDRLRSEKLVRTPEIDKLLETGENTEIVDSEDAPMPEISEHELAEMDKLYEEYGLSEDLEDFSNALGNGFI